jgi:hypothetical protein
MYVYKVLKLFFIRSKNCKQDNEYKDKLRITEGFIVPRPKSTFYTMSESYLGPKFFNKLPDHIKLEINIKLFLKRLREWLFGIDDIEGFLFNIQA